MTLAIERWMHAHEDYQVDVFNVVMDQIVTSTNSRFENHKDFTKIFPVWTLNSFSSGRKVAILSGVVLNTYIFQTIHRTETEIASFERGGLPLSKIPISISSRAWLTSYLHNFA